MNKLRLLLSALAIIIIATSCSTSKQARAYRSSVDGNWQLQTITTEGIVGKVKSQILDEASLDCFIGTNWRFNRANSLGSYEITKNAGECAAIKRSFRWSITDENGVPKLLQFKKVDNRFRDIEDGKVGYRFTILNIEEKTMQIKNDVTFEGRPASFIYNFIKM